MPVAWRHESSHERLPFNEFADIAAKRQTKHTEFGHNISPASQWATSEPDAASWAFLYTAGPEMRMAYPIKEINQELYLSATLTPVPQLRVDADVISHHLDGFRKMMSPLTATSWRTQLT